MSLPVPTYGCYCTTCFQFVPDRAVKEDAQIADLAKRDRTIDRWRAAFAEVYGVPFWSVKHWKLRPGISVLAGQVMANDIKRSQLGDGARLNALKAAKKAAREPLGKQGAKL